MLACSPAAVSFPTGVRVTTSIDRQIAQELGVREDQVAAAVVLLDGDATVPFIARYRKEATGALDDAQLRSLDERLHYLRELEERRTVILNSIRQQGKLNDVLEATIRAADSKSWLEDIYLPFKPKRHTKAEIAKEAGLEPLADLLLTKPENDPLVAAARFVDAEKQVADVAAALEGARAILVERFAEDADLIGSLREEMWATGRLASKVRQGKQEAGAKFSDYFDFAEKLAKVPSHRILALFRAEKEEILDVAVEPEDPATASGGSSPYELRIMHRFGISTISGSGGTIAQLGARLHPQQSDRYAVPAQGPERRRRGAHQLSEPRGRGHPVADPDARSRLGLVPGFRRPVRRSGTQSRFRSAGRLRLPPQSGAGQRGVRGRRHDPCLDGSLCARRGLDHLRSDQSQRRRLQPDSRRRRTPYPPGHAWCC